MPLHPYAHSCPGDMMDVDSDGAPWNEIAMGDEWKEKLEEIFLENKLNQQQTQDDVAYFLQNTAALRTAWCRCKL